MDPGGRLPQREMRSASSEERSLPAPYAPAPTEAAHISSPTRSDKQPVIRNTSQPVAAGAVQFVANLGYRT